jgi:N-glycosylase/DNA lyase
MEDLINSINQLKDSEISEVINDRIEEFSSIKEGTIEDIFIEMCFCIMTANCGAEKCIEIHELIGNDFLNLSENELIFAFKKYGYRFPNVRANYVIESRKLIKELEDTLKDSKNEANLREWIVKNVKGLGYKEASHFLRNVGFQDYAIIDFHIVDLLVKYHLINKPKTMTKSKYLEIEGILKELGEKLKLNMAQLDLYLWYMETGKVLK